VLTMPINSDAKKRRLLATLVRQAQLGASYRVPYPCIKVGSPYRVKLNQQPVPSVARLAERKYCEQQS
jgi:hypothetical protein